MKNILIVFLSFYCASCATTGPVVYKKVYIPVKCKVEAPERPAIDTQDPKRLNLILFEYIQKLEGVLKKCL